MKYNFKAIESKWQQKWEESSKMAFASLLILFFCYIYLNLFVFELSAKLVKITQF